MAIARWGSARPANPNGTTRSGTITIATRTFTVTQAAAPCTYHVDPAQPIGGVDGRYRFNSRGGADRVRLDRRQQPHVVADSDERRERQWQRHGGVQCVGQSQRNDAQRHDHDRGPDVQRQPGGGAVHVFHLAPEPVGRRGNCDGLNSCGRASWLRLDGRQQRHGWLTVTSGASGSGDGNVTFSASANASSIVAHGHVDGGRPDIHGDAGRGRLHIRDFIEQLVGGGRRRHGLDNRDLGRRLRLVRGQ